MRAAGAVVLLDELRPVNRWHLRFKLCKSLSLHLLVGCLLINVVVFRKERDAGHRHDVPVNPSTDVNHLVLLVMDGNRGLVLAPVILVHLPESKLFQCGLVPFDSCTLRTPDRETEHKYTGGELIRLNREAFVPHPYRQWVLFISSHPPHVVGGIAGMDPRRGIHQLTHCTRRFDTGSCRTLVDPQMLRPLLVLLHHAPPDLLQPHLQLRVLLIR